MVSFPVPVCSTFCAAASWSSSTSISVFATAYPFRPLVSISLRAVSGYTGWQAAGSGEKMPCVCGSDRVRMLACRRALSFGIVAEPTNGFRPGDPGALLDLVMRYAGLPVPTALEIGALASKATRLFADRGLAVTATEPDRKMLALNCVSMCLPHHQDDASRVRGLATGGELRTCLCGGVAALDELGEPVGLRMAAPPELGRGVASFGGPVGLADAARRKLSANGGQGAVPGERRYSVSGRDAARK